MAAEIVIAVLNQSTVATDSEVEIVAAHLQIQVSRDFAPIWGVDAIVHFLPKTSKPSPSTWQLVILDDSDQAGALGYHDLTASGMPLAKIFARTTIDAGLSWSVTASHEIMEMLVDPDINLTAFVQTSDTAGTLYAYEVADACEDDSFGYDIGTLQPTRVSDFVTPAWFEPQGTNTNPKFDFRGHVTAPFQILSGGYIGVFDVTGGTGWTQLTADKVTAREAGLRPRFETRKTVRRQRSRH